MLRKLFLCLASVAVASVASGLIVVVIEPVSSAGAHGSDPFPITVNRALKGDRFKSDQMPLHLAAQPHSQSAGPARPDAAAVINPNKAPIGCDPSFSPVVSPSLANVFGRCTT